MMTHLRNFDSLAILFILIAVFLVPIAFLPFSSAPFQITKLFLISLTTLIALISWAVARLKENRLSFPFHLVFFSSLLIPLVYFISALFSGNIGKSLIGSGFEIDTVFMMAMMVLTLFLGSTLFNTNERIIRLYFVAIASAFIFALFQIIRLFFGPDVLVFNLFGNTTSNLLGKWNDVAIFFGLIGTLSVMTIDLLQTRILFLKKVLYASLAVSLFLLAIVNFFPVWVVLGTVSFFLIVRAFFAHRLAGDTEAPSPRFSAASLFVLVVSLIFIFSGNVLGNALSDRFNIAQVEVRPSWQSTFDIMKAVYEEDALLGTGPNTFSQQWLSHKSVNINESPFWNIDFSFAVGTIPTFFITTGVLGVAAWLLFFATFLFSGVRALIRLKGNQLEQYLGLSSFIAALFLWIFAIIYVPHSFFLFLAFLFTGIFIAVQVHTNVSRSREIIFSENPRIGFILIGLLLVLVIGSGALIYIIANKYTSAVYVQKVSVVANTGGNIDDAERYINQALLFDESSRAYRVATDIGLARLSEITSRENPTTQTQQEFQETLGRTIRYAQAAVTRDNQDYQNWVALAKIYEGLIRLQIDGAYDNAQAAYTNAVSVNPRSPQLRLQLARIAALADDNQTARNYIAEALQLKSNYTDAIFLLSQIEIQEGEIDKAIGSVESASFLDPNNAGIAFQLGLLKYSKNDFAGARDAFERAVLINGQYANARYFLGLSYYQLGDRAASLEQFKVVEALNPDNVEVKAIIENLSADKEPFAGIEPPADERSVPPIEE